MAAAIHMRDVSAGGWVSGVSHIALITWLLAGWGLSHDPLDFQVTPVTTISGDDYARLVAGSTPDPATEVGTVVEPPPAEDAPPPPETVDTPPPVQEQPPPPEVPVDETPPPPAPDPIPQPAEVTDTPPEMAVPEPFAPPPAPEAATRPQARPAPRVAPEPVAPPPPEAEVAPVVQDQVSPEAETPDVVEEAAEATAPEETTTEIVTEAAQPSGAPETALRPQTRPSRPTPAQPPAETTTASSNNAADNTADDIAAAVAAASANAGTPTTNPGPPMTGAERDAFRIAVSGCWAVDPGSEAGRVSITVAFNLDRSGRVEGDVRLVGSANGAQGAVDTAFGFARRAIIRCQGQGGYDLPADKYEQWRVVEMTFDPSGMRY